MDIESGVDALIASGKADPARLFYGGWSWGGYLTAWTIGHAHADTAPRWPAPAFVDTVFPVRHLGHQSRAAAAWSSRGDPWRQHRRLRRAANPWRFSATWSPRPSSSTGEADDTRPSPTADPLARPSSIRVPTSSGLPPASRTVHGEGPRVATCSSAGRSGCARHDRRPRRPAREVTTVRSSG